MRATQTSLDGGEWVPMMSGPFQMRYHLFKFEMLLIDNTPKLYRAVGDIPLKKLTIEPTEHVVIVSEDGSTGLVEKIKEFIGDSMRDELHERWSTGDEKTARDWVVDHPEVKGAVLTWTWTHRAIYSDDGFVFNASGEVYDLEYSFAGLRSDLLEHLGNYDCWDCIFGHKVLTVDEFGILRVSYCSESPSLFDIHHYEDDFQSPVLGDMIDNTDEELRGLVWDNIMERIRKGELREYELKIKMREAGFE